MPRSGSTFPRRVVRGVLAAAAVTGAWLAFGAQNASADVRLRPTEDVKSTWMTVRAQTASQAINDAADAGKRRSRRDFILARRPGRTTEVALSDMSLAPGEWVTDADIRIRARSFKRSRIKVTALVEGVATGEKTIKLGRRARWGQLRFAIPTAEALDAIQLRVESKGGRWTRIDAALAKITTTGDTPDPDPDPEPEPTAGNVLAFGSNVSIRPDRSLPNGGRQTASMLSARNEFESFQVGIEATDGSIQDVDVELAGPLTGPGGASIPETNVTVYREASYTVDPGAGKPRSSRQGGNGEWPDALIPETDYFYGEDRKAFPYDLSNGRTIGAWIDVLAPASAPAGVYTGEVEVKSGASEIATLPIELQVTAAQLPSTPSLKSSFPINSNYTEPCQSHTGSDCVHTSEDSWRLHYLYARAGLENRMTVSNPMPLPFDVAPSGALADKWLRPLIQGGASPDGAIASPRLAGSRLTSVKAYWQCAQSRQCMEKWKGLAEQWDFADRFFAYICDEPVNGNAPYDFDDWGDCRRNARDAEEGWPGVRRMLTATVDEANNADGGFDASRDVDILTPLIVFMNNRPNNPFAGNQRPTYNSFLGASGSDPGTPENEVWMYNACSSYQCAEVEGAYWDDWAGYAIDAPPAQARSMGWLSYLYDVDGELYWNTTRRLDSAWTNQYAQGQNGDGTLFYPGRVNGGNGAPAIGGEHDIPIESIRMKRIRDGREDYEVLHQLEENGLRSQALPILTEMTGNTNAATFSADATQTELNGTRCELYDLLSALGSECVL